MTVLKYIFFFFDKEVEELYLSKYDKSVVNGDIHHTYVVYLKHYHLLILIS